MSNSYPKIVFSSCYQEMIKVDQTFECCKEMLWNACSAKCSCVLFEKGWETALLEEFLYLDVDSYEPVLCSLLLASPAKWSQK